jgi:hypothetical protein
MQKLFEMHDTDVRNPPGTVCKAQVDPLHISAPPPSALELEPTASQNFVETHDTALRVIRRPLAA